MSVKKRPPATNAAAKSISSVALLGLLAACGGGSGGASPDAASSFTAVSKVQLSGNVGETVTGALVYASDASGMVGVETTSDATTEYSLTLPEGTEFPVRLEATEGTDMVSGGPLDFTLRSVATAGSDQTANINPFTTVIVEAAALMDGGLNAANLERARELVVDAFSFGLDPALVPNPIDTPITSENIASVVKANEALKETIRRVRDALMSAGQDISADDIVYSLSGDLTDGAIDGQGPAGDPLLAAATNVLAAQVLVEALQNNIQVQSTDAAALMDSAIRMTKPQAMQQTAEVMITEGLLRQARVALAAAQVYLPDNALADLSAAVDAMQPNISAEQAAELIPADSLGALSTLNLVTFADDATVAAINEAARNATYAGSVLPPNDGGTNTTSPGDGTDSSAPADQSEKAITGDYYVAKDGSDSNPGSVDRPFGSLEKAQAVARPGDVIVIRGGTYPLKQRFRNSGTSSAPITWVAYPGEKVVFDGSGKVEGVDGDRFNIEGDWNVFRDLEVKNSPSKGVYITGDNNRLENIVAHHNRGTGIQIVGGNNNIIANSIAHANHETLKNGDNSDGFSVSSGSRNKFYKCVAYNNSDDGFDLWQSAYTVIDRSAAYDNGYDTGGNGTGFKLGGGASATDSFGFHKVTNSVAYNNKENGFHWNSNRTPNTLYNNTAWNNGSTASAYPHNFNFGAGAHVLKNNISLNGSINLGSDVKEQNNSWNKGISDPKFLSLDPTSPDFLRLAPDSPAIDSGVNVGLPYNGDAPDLGAYETN